MGGIFISYRREDSAGWAGRLAETLTEQFGPKSIFMDIDTVEPGADFTEVLQKAISCCDVLLAIIGPEWATATDKSGKLRIHDPNDWVRIEIATALKRKVRVIPVLVGGASIPSMDLLPDELDPLAHRQAHELTDKRWHFDVEQLIRTFPGGLRKPWRIPHMQLAPATPVIIGGLVIAAMVVLWAMFSTFYTPIQSNAFGTGIPQPPAPPVPTIPITFTNQIPPTPSNLTRDEPLSASGNSPQTDTPLLTLRVGQEAHLQDHVTSCVYKVLSAMIEHSRPDQHVLRLIVRVTNEGSMSTSFGEGNFRLLVDNVPRAPTGHLDDVVEAHSAKEGTIVFAVPINATRFALQFLMGDEKATFPL